MGPLFYLANALVMPPAMYFAWNYYRYNGKQIRFGRLWISMILLLITVVVTGLQFPYPRDNSCTEPRPSGAFLR